MKPLLQRRVFPSEFDDFLRDNASEESCDWRNRAAAEAYRLLKNIGVDFTIEIFRIFLLKF